jgi:hypothetical protein
MCSVVRGVCNKSEEANCGKISGHTSAKSVKSGFRTGQGPSIRLDTYVEWVTIKLEIKEHWMIANHFAIRTKSSCNTELGGRGMEERRAGGFDT